MPMNIRPSTCHILIILRWIRDHMSYKRIPFIHRVPILASTLQSEAGPATSSASSSLLIILQYGENHSTEDADVESIVQYQQPLCFCEDSIPR